MFTQSINQLLIVYIKYEMHMDNIKKFQIKNYQFKFQLRQQTLFVQATSKNNPAGIYWLQISQDTMICNKMVFQNPKELYQYLEDFCFSNECLQFNPPQEIVILYKLGKNVKRMPLVMTEKILTKQQQQQIKIKDLQAQVQKLKKQLMQVNQNFKIMELQIIQEEKDMEIMMLKSIIQEQKIELLTLRQNINKESQDLKQDLIKQNEIILQKQVKDLKQIIQLKTTQINAHKQQIQTQSMIIKELQSLVKQNREIISALTGDSNKASKPQQTQNLHYSHLLIFKPNKNSININYYKYNDNIITKNNQSLSGTGKFLYSDVPIPKIGRFHYKIKNKYSVSLPNFRIGVIGRQNLEGEVYMNAGESDSIMYYCFNTDKQIIYEGHNKIEGFKVKKDQIITIVIDAQKYQVEWYLQQNLQLISKFTQSMKSAPQLFFFIQLWQNGDALEIITK